MLIHYTFRSNTNVENLSFRQNKHYQNWILFFFLKIQLIAVLLLIRNSYTSGSTWFISLKLCVRFSIFDSI